LHLKTLLFQNAGYGWTPVSVVSMKNIPLSFERQDFFSPYHYLCLANFWYTSSYRFFSPLSGSQFTSILVHQRRSLPVLLEQPVVWSLFHLQILRMRTNVVFFEAPGQLCTLTCFMHTCGVVSEDFTPFSPEFPAFFTPDGRTVSFPP